MIITFTGAGISKESGVDTFQDQPGIREKLHRHWANAHPKEYNEIINDFTRVCNLAEPNNAHKVLAEHNIPVITMNIDGLHDRAGSKHVIHLHGNLPNIVLYEDPAPEYERAYNILWNLEKGDVLLVIGASTYTNISSQLRIFAISRGAEIVEIQDNASTKVREYLENNIDKIETMNEYLKRAEND